MKIDKLKVDASPDRRRCHWLNFYSLESLFQTAHRKIYTDDVDPVEVIH